MKTPKITVNNELRPVTNDEMEKVAAGFGFGACIGVGAGCTSKKPKGNGVHVGVCFFFGAM